MKTKTMMTIPPSPPRSLLTCFETTVVLCAYCEKEFKAKTLYSHWRSCQQKAAIDGKTEAVNEKKAKQQVRGDIAAITGLAPMACSLRSHFTSQDAVRRYQVKDDSKKKRKERSLRNAYALENPFVPEATAAEPEKRLVPLFQDLSEHHPLRWVSQNNHVRDNV
jgi:hypothetical protein